MLLLFLAGTVSTSFAATELKVTSAEIFGSKLMIVLSEPVDPASLNESTLYLLGSNGRIGREVQFAEHGRRLMLRLRPRHFSELFQPLLLVMTPELKGVSKSGLQRGLVKVFNLVEIVPGQGKPRFEKKIIKVSSDPRIELEVLDLKVFWHKDRFRGKGLKIFDRFEKDDWRQMEKCWDDEHNEKERRCGKFEHFDHNRLHRPNLTVAGIADGQTVDHDVQINFSANDPDNDLRLLQALLDFQGFSSGTTIQIKGQHWFFAVAIDIWHLFDYKFMRFTIEKTPLEFITLTPAADFSTREANLVIQGEVRGAAKLTINDQEVTLTAGKFQKNFTLLSGANVFKVAAIDSDGLKIEKSFIATYIVDTEPPRITISTPLNSSFFNIAVTAVSGQITDQSRVDAVTVNGLPAIVSGQTFTLAALPLLEGVNNIMVQAIDEYGNTGNAQIAVTLDTIAPEITVTSPAADALVNLPLGNVNGKAEDVNLLKVSVANTQGQIVGNNFYLEGLPLSEGQNQLIIEAEDRAGNKTQKTLILVLDSLPPNLQITSPAVNALLSTPAVTVSGTVTDAHETNVKVNDIKANMDSGNFSSLIPLRQGVNRITVVARDLAGNSVAQNRDVTVDSLPPQLSFLAPTDGMILNTRTIVVAGNCTEANIASIKINGHTAAIENQTFTLADLQLLEGTNTIEAVAVDLAGNQGTLKISIFVDTQAPEIKAVLPAAGMEQVSIESRVEIEFSETILPATLSDTVIYVSKANGEKISGSLTLENGNKVKFFPATPLPDSSALTVHVSTAISDLARNNLPTPYAGTFSTVDLTPPLAPELQPIPEHTTLTKIAVAGTAEAGSKLMISGAAATMEIMVAGNNTFSAEVMLKPNQLNQLYFNAIDAAGNQSLPAQLAIYQDAANFTVIDALYDNNQIRIIFSNPVDAETLNATTLKVSTLQGVEPGTISVSNETALFQPAADLASRAFLLEISTAVIDSNGDSLPAPFAKMFNQQGAQTIVMGEVYDDASGLPLAGALVKLIDVNGSAPSAPVPTALTTQEGQYALLLPAAASTLRVEKEGYCRADRAVIALSGFSATVFDARLAPQNAQEYSLQPEGCTISTASESPIQLILPPQAISEEQKIRIAPIAPQALQGRLPFGWSPLTVIDIWPATITFAAPATLSIPLAQTFSLPASSTLVLARWDDQTFKWRVVSIIPGGITPPLQIETAIQATGQYALLIADTLPVTPAAAIVNEPLSSVPAAVIPALITAKLEFIPGEIYPGQTTTGSLLINTLAPVSSGVPVQAKVSESHELLSGAKALYAPYIADLTAYYNGANQLRVYFNLSPNQEIALADLKIGKLDTGLNRYSSGVTGMVIGSDGGSVSGEDGIEATLEPGAVEQPLAVSLKKTPMENLSLTVPAGFNFLGAIEFSISGTTLKKSAVLAMELTPDVLAAIPSDAQLILCRLTRIDNVYVYLNAQTAFIAAGKIKNSSDAQAPLPFSGVRQGGTYVFLQCLSPAGFFKGLVTDKGLPAKDALVTVSGHDVFSLSHASGAYAQIAFLGNRRLEARNRLSNDLGSASGNIAAAGEVKTLDIAIEPTGPTVVGISPADKAETVPLNSKIQVIFSEAIRAATFNNNNFYISAGPLKLAGIYKLSPDSLQGEFVPAQPLPSDKIISVTLATGIQDISGNPMVMGFSSTFRTKDIIPPASDISLIRKYIPEDGFCRVVGLPSPGEGLPGAIEPGALLMVTNDRTGEVVTVSGLSNGSFKDVLIKALISDTIIITVKDLAGNKINVDPGPFTSVDGKGAVLDAKAAEFISSEGLGIKIAPNTFNAPVLVRIEAVTNTQDLAVAPVNFSRLQAMKVDFSGARPALPWKVSISAPASLPTGAAFFIAHEVTVFGEKKLMIVDTCALKDGRIEVNSPPWPGLLQTELNVLSILITHMTYSLATGYAPSASAMVSAMDLVYIPSSWSARQFIFPIPVGQNFTLTVRDMDTGETLFSGAKTAADTAGQTYELSDNLANDFARPQLLGVSGLNVSACQWTSTKTTLGNLTIEPESNGCKITGKEKTAAPDGKIRIQVIHFDQVSGKESVTTSEFSANPDGSFIINNIAVKFADKMVLSIEKDNVALDREFALDFSESLQEENIENAVRLKEIVSGKETPCFVELAANQSTILVRPKQTLKEDTRYSIECRDIKDCSDNTLNLTVDFRTKKSTSLDLAETGGAYESVIFGKYLIVAAGDQGLKIVDTSNPAKLAVVGIYNAFENVRGVSLYTTADNTTYALMVGGSADTFGYLKWIDISDPRQPHQVKSQIVSGMEDSQNFNLPQGIPLRVRIIGDYAFVAVFGYEAGLIAVNLNKMTAGSNRDCIMGRFAVDYVNDLEVFVDKTTNADGSVSQNVRALLLIDYYGLKMVNITNPSQMKAEGSYELLSRDHVHGLDVALAYKYDQDNDGRSGEKEELSEDLDKDGSYGEKEIGDFAFFSFPERHELFVLDITSRSGEFSKVGAVVFKDAAGLGDMFFSQAAKKLYLCDMSQGVYVLDMKNPLGFNLDKNGDGIDDRIAAVIKTGGPNRYGLVVDEKLQLLYAGDLERGIQSVKTANPQVKIMVKGDDGKYRDEPILQPWGLEKPTDYVTNYPQNKDIYVMVYLPQIAAEPGMQVKAELWSLNVAGAPLAPWNLIPSLPLTFISSQQMLLTSDINAKPEDEAYNLFKSVPVRLTFDPNDTLGDKKLLSGDLLRAFLVFSDTLSNELTYLPANDLEQAYAEKTALRAELVDSEKPEPANNPSTGSGETSFAGPGLMDISSASGVYLHSGEFFDIETDLRLPGRGFDFAFTRRYESQSIYSGPLGWNWDHTYNRRLLELPNGDILYFNGQGRRERYVAQKSGSVITGYKAPAGAFNELKKRQDGTFTLINSDRFIEIFDPAGRLSRLQDRNANKMEFYYDFGGSLSAVLDTMGRLITFEYYPVAMKDPQTMTPESGRLKSITDFTQRQITYEYDDKGDLVKATLGERFKEYTYTDDNDLEQGHNLLSITDPNNQKYLALTYNGDDQLTSEKIGNSTVTISSGASASTTDGNGNTRSYSHNEAGNPVAVTEGGAQTSFSYNTEGLVTSITKPMGNKTEFVYDTSNSERRAQSNLLQVKETPDARGGSTLTTAYTYEANTNQVISMTDPKGSRTSYSRQNAAGNIDSVIAPLNATYSYAYNQYGQPTQMTDPKGAITAYSYYPEAAPAGNGAVSESGRALDSTTGGYLSAVIVDQAADKISSAYVYNDVGNVTIQTNGEGIPMQIDVDQYNQIKSVASGMGDALISTYYTRDANNNVTSKAERGITETYANFNMANQPLNMTRTGGGLTQQFIYEYDNNFNLKTITYPKGNQDAFTYDERNLVKTKTMGNITSLGYVYDNNANLTHFTDGEHNVWQTIYDGHDRVKGKSDPLQNTVNYTLDENSNLTNVSGPENLMVNNQFDELNRMNSSTVSGNITQGFQYDPAGNMTKYTNPNNHAWNYTAGGSGLLKTTSDPLGNGASYAYDKRALPLSVNETENGGRSLNHSISYNALGNVNSTDDSIQRKWQTHYDLATQLPQDNIDPENGAVASSYDGLNRLNKGTRYINYNGSTIPSDNNYEYDLNNNLVAVKDANGNRTSYQYDDKDRLTTVTYPDSRSESYTYDKNDQLLSLTDANGTVVSNTFDAAGRLTSRTIAPASGIEGPTHESFTYDGQSRLVRAENENTITTLTYDNAGRLTGEKQQTKNNETITGTYDVSSGFDNNGNKTSLSYPSGKALSITADALDRITTIQSGSTPIAAYTYEGQDKVTGKTLGNAIQLSAQYDDGKRPTTFKYANTLTSKDIIDQAMTWNKVDLKTGETRADAASQSKNFEYDSAYRLRKSTAAQNETEYDIDSSDNIKQVKEVKEGVAQVVNHDVNNRNQVTTLGNKTLTWDNNGNLIQMSGNGSTTNYTYDYKNQLVKVTTAGTQVEFMYDALGRRVQKKAVYPSSSATTKYVYDGNQVIEERDGANVLKSRYAYGNGIDEPVEIEKANTAGAMASYLPMQDTNGNVIALADSTGKLIEKVNYSAYGSPKFIYDHVAPQVDQVRLVSGKINIRFSEAVDKDKAKDAINIKLGVNPVSGTLTFADEDRVAIFTPTAALPQNQALTVSISTQLEDTSGNTLTAEFTQTFTFTGSDIVVFDRVAPETELVNLISNKFTIGLSEEIDQASINGSVVVKRGTVVLTGTIAYENPKAISFTLSNSLTNGTAYTIEINSNLKDLSGKGLAAFSKTFTYQNTDLLVYSKPSEKEHQESFVKNTTLFQGRSFDSETGLYYFRARYLQPELGRFLQTDPVGYQDSLNLYQSFGNNPINFTDPMGLYNEDFHFYVINYLMRSRGWDPEISEQVAGWSQYVDDDSFSSPTSWGNLTNATGDFLVDKIISDDRVGFFHFYSTSAQRTVYRGDKGAEQIVKDQRNAFYKIEEGLFIRLGVSLHIYADTYAHETWKSPLGHATVLQEPEKINANKTSSDRALQAAEYIYSMLPRPSKAFWADGNEPMDWEEVKYLLSEAFEPVENQKKLSVSKANSRVINRLRSIFGEKFGDIKYDKNKFKKDRNYFVSMIKKYLYRYKR